MDNNHFSANDKPEKVYLTREGLQELKKEFKALVDQRRPRAIQRLTETRVIGDTEENTDHTQAKQDLAFIEGRIAELEGVLAKAVVINENHGSSKQIGLGCKVTVKAGSDEHVFHLVGEWEADPAQQKISHESPLGQALFGKKVGDEVEVEAPAGKIIYTILKIN